MDVASKAWNNATKGKLTGDIYGTLNFRDDLPADRTVTTESFSLLSFVTILEERRNLENVTRCLRFVTFERCQPTFAAPPSEQSNVARYLLVPLKPAMEYSLSGLLDGHDLSDTARIASSYVEHSWTKLTLPFGNKYTFRDPRLRSASRQLECLMKLIFVEKRSRGFSSRG